MYRVIVMPPACARPDAQSRITGEITAHRTYWLLSDNLALLAAVAGEVVR
ncbi:hypothetical protein [Streptomyces viridochromogenes]|uniref:Uncharacterized protein n=1 Tax=Streptomyces viridochromogenes Tue57 TaxID=1160705 RepID=L8PHN7_STRVR|nr:hypothetical protein [Streptomyces viridochromogenes]ELS55694.1 hypothetical protein STVIR_3346 [Streptomyces viridochromogenes Tue57]